MILVNNPGNALPYFPCTLAERLTPTDLIFLFLLLLAVPRPPVVRMARRIETDTLAALFSRSVIIFLIGYRSAFLLPLTTWRVAGVLQRIALAYLAAALITLAFKARGIAIWIAGLLVGYWIAMRFIPVPGFGMPGTGMPLLAPDANMSWYLDDRFLPGRMYEVTRDPEGILSTFPAIATALMGVLTGEWLATHRDAREQPACWLRRPACRRTVLGHLT